MFTQFLVMERSKEFYLKVKRRCRAEDLNRDSLISVMNGENGIQLCQEIAHLKCQDKIHGHFTIGPQPFLQQSLIISFNLKFRKQVGMLTQ